MKTYILRKGLYYIAAEKSGTGWSISAPSYDRPKMGFTSLEDVLKVLEMIPDNSDIEIIDFTHPWKYEIVKI